MADYGLDKHLNDIGMTKSDWMKYGDKGKPKTAADVEAEEVAEAVATMAQIQYPHKLAQEDAEQGLVQRERDLAVEKAREVFARVQSLPESSYAYREAKLKLDQAESLARGNQYFERDTQNIAAGGCTTVDLPGLEVPKLKLVKDEEYSGMDVWMIWATDKTDPTGVVWLEEAWDDDMVSANKDGWDAAVSKAFEDYGGECVRIVKTTVNLSKIQAAFLPTEV